MSSPGERKRSWSAGGAARGYQLLKSNRYTDFSSAKSLLSTAMFGAAELGELSFAAAGCTPGATPGNFLAALLAPAPGKPGIQGKSLGKSLGKPLGNLTWNLNSYRRYPICRIVGRASSYAS